MKAVVATNYGPPEVLELRDVAKPVPNDNEVLVKVIATTVTAGDSRVRSFTVPRSFWLPARITLGLRKPKKAILGMVLAGQVESVSKDVKRFKPSDTVYAYDITHLSTYAYISENWDFTTPIGRLMLAMFAALAEWYVNNLSDETSKGKRERARNGSWNDTLPFGYTTPRRLKQMLLDLGSDFEAGGVDEAE